MIQVIIYIAAFIYIAVYFWFNKNTNIPSGSQPISLKSIKNINESANPLPYINPQPYNTGYITSPQTLANACGANVMYPIQPRYANYGSWKNGGDCCSGSCDNLIFNSPP
jgi:hypothetical protein